MTRPDRAPENRETSSPALAAVPISGSGAAAAYAAALLASLEVPTVATPGPADPKHGDAWARSGAMALTGAADGPPQSAPGPIASCADGAARALAGLAERLTGRTLRTLDGAALLGERAALADPVLARAGATSVGGSSRMIHCRDGWLALNLARPEDTSLLPAWLEREPTAALDPWAFVADEALHRSRETLVARGREMGLAVAPVAGARPAAPPAAPRESPGEARAPKPWHRIAAGGARRLVEARPLVVDLSALWAGPLCGQLLAACGARVVKLESIERPDGARRGEPAFFDVMNSEKESVALPLRDERGQRLLAALLERADIVIEASRPRALEQLGIHAEALVSRHGITWVSITGYGRRLPEAGWVAFGDDAAVAAGLVATQPDGTPCFCGDAIADPLTGLHAAVAALAGWSSGAGRLLDVSLYGVARHVRAFSAAADRATTDSARADSTAAAGATNLEPVRAPRARPAARRAPELGADTDRVLGELGLSC